MATATYSRRNTTEQRSRLDAIMAKRDVAGIVLCSYQAVSYFRAVRSDEGSNPSPSAFIQAKFRAARAGAGENARVPKTAAFIRNG